MNNLEYQINHGKTRYSILRGICKGLQAGFGIALGALAAAGCGGQEPQPPVAALVVSPEKGAKPLDVLLDASGSTSETLITQYDFDFDGDGTPDYSETSADAPDGVFDGKTTANYPSEGDFNPEVTVTNWGGKSDSEAAYLGVGFGDDVAGALDYVAANIHQDYTQTRNQDFQLFDPSTAMMVAFVADIKGSDASLGEIYTIYDWDRLTPEQQNCLLSREADGMNEPTVILVRDDDSPNAIDQLLDSVGAKKSASKTYEPLDVQEEVF